MSKRTRYSVEFKAKVAKEAIKGEETLAHVLRFRSASHADFSLEAADAEWADGYFYGQGDAPKGPRKGNLGVARQDRAIDRGA